MKKAIYFVLAVLLVVSLAPSVLAADETQANKSTILTTTVPGAKYTLNIPKDQTVKFGEESTMIGNVTVTDGENFAVGKNLEVTVTYNPFTSTDVDTTIPYKLVKYAWDTKYKNSVDIANNDVLIFEGLPSTEETCIRKYSGIPSTNAMGSPISIDMEGIDLKIASSDWGKALAGDYTATITFTAAVVAAQ